MGNTIATTYEDNANLEFFKNLNINLVEEVFDELNSVAPDDLDPKYILWTEYFGTLCRIHEKNKTKKNLLARNQWHPATDGYVMESAKKSATETSTIQSSSSRSSKPDDYTDDSGSSSDEEEQSESSSTNEEPVSVPKVYDASIMSPVFFGYSKTKTIDREEELAAIQEQDQQREFKAIEYAKSYRQEHISKTEQSTINKQQGRQKKIDTLEQKYQENATKRRQEFEKLTAGLLDGQLKNVQVSYVHFISINIILMLLF